MHRIALAFRAFFTILANALKAEQIEDVLRGEKTAGSEPPAKQSPLPTPPELAARKTPSRSDALTLLSALQREARLVDFIQEPIAAYSDAQIGAAVRDIHRDCAALVERVFALRPVDSSAEGASVQVPAGFDAARTRLVGNVTGQPPFDGRLAHHGWEATRCELPAWTGGERAIFVVAPAEVEIQ
jgi:hypothetical protein